MISIKKSFSLILLSLFVNQLNAGRTFDNLWSYPKTSFFSAGVAGYIGYKAGCDADLNAAIATSAGLAAAQIQSEANKKGECDLFGSTKEVLKEGVKPWIGHLIGQYGIIGVSKLFKLINWSVDQTGGLVNIKVPDAVIPPEIKVPTTVINAAILIYFTYMKSTRQIEEIN